MRREGGVGWCFRRHLYGNEDNGKGGGGGGEKEGKREEKKGEGEKRTRKIEEW